MTARTLAGGLTALALAVSGWAAETKAGGSEHGAPADSALDHFFGQLADSTDRYFGRAAAPLDTTGLDSARSAVHVGTQRRPPRALELGLGPALRFNRVEGAVYGATAGIGGREEAGRLAGRLEYAAGQRLWQGGGGWEAQRGTEERSATLSAWVGRGTAVMDRLVETGAGDPLGSLGALVIGRDTRSFMRWDGWSVTAARVRTSWRVTLGWRDMLETPLAVSAGWNLAHRALEVADNPPATLGRAREARIAVTAHLPRTPVVAELDERISRRALGSDFEYRMTRLAFGTDVGLGRASVLIPQAVYGRLSGEPLAQESFDLSGTGALTTLAGERLGGSSVALARLDWLGTRDVLELLHVVHPAFLPLQISAFAASGAAWGADPFGGPSRPGVDWPGSGAWHSECGVALVWQPGIPEATSMGRLSVAWPLGGAPRSAHVTLRFSRAIFLLSPAGH